MAEENLIQEQFNKIKIVDFIANSIANYGVQNGYENLLDKVDLSCGAVPEGELSQVIDFSSPHQFLMLYTQIAERRLAMAVTEVLKMNTAFIKPILDFCGSVGAQMNIESIENPDAAFNLYNAFVLDGMPCDETKHLLEKTDSSIRWSKLIDTHEEAWKKAEGDISVYYKILEAFVNGLFNKTGFHLEVENLQFFTLKKC